MGISAGSLSECLQTDILRVESTVSVLLLPKKHSSKASLNPVPQRQLALNDNLAAMAIVHVVDESHTIETWNGKR